MAKRITALLLAFMLIVSMSAIPIFAATQTFSDVPTSAWYYSVVENLAGKGIINGYPDGTFRPSNNVERQHVAVMVMKGAGIKNSGKKADFTDVSSTNQFSTFIATLAEKGIINGFPDGTFRPKDNVTRGQAAIMISKAFGLTSAMHIEDFKDTVGHYASKQILTLNSHGIINGYSDGTFRPNASVTRAEISKMISFAMEVAEGLEVVSVSAIEDIEVEYGGSYELPETVEVTLSDDTIVTVPVIWDDSEVKVDKSGTYEVLGTLDVLGLENIAETDLMANVNVVVAARVDVECILLSHTELTLTEEENFSLSATVLPENATNKNLLWFTSDENVATVDGQGVVQAKNAGQAIITVTDTLGNITSDVIVTVEKPTIVSIEDITANVIQYDSYTLPTTVTALMSNGTIQEFAISWLDSSVDTSILGTQDFIGAVENYEQSITLTLIVEEYDPQIVTNSYSSVTVNNLSKSLSLNINNYGTKPMSIEKIEIYERGRLSSTYTTQSLIDSGIETVVQPGGRWGVSVTFKLGIWLDNSYVKYYVSANNTNYEYEDSLERN